MLRKGVRYIIIALAIAAGIIMLNTQEEEEEEKPASSPVTMPKYSVPDSCVP